MAKELISCRRLLEDFEEEYILDDEPEDLQNHLHHKEDLSAQSFR